MLKLLDLSRMKSEGVQGKEASLVDGENQQQDGKEVFFIVLFTIISWLFCFNLIYSTNML